MRPRYGETVGGDLALATAQPDGLLLAIVDVLGHGPQAHPLTLQLASALEAARCDDMGRLLRQLHERFQGSRGAAIGLCSITPGDGTVRYVGIGNTAMRRFGDGESRLVSQDGVLGQNMRTPLLQTMQLQAGDVVILHTDGISARFTEKDYPGLMSHPAQEVAEKIVQRFGKEHDDAACIVVRYQP